MASMIAKRARDIEPRTTTSYPRMFHERVLPREVRRLGDAFGLTSFGVNLMTLMPGKASSLRHHHSHEDEFVYVLEGEVVLRTDHGDELLTPGMVVGFRAGDGNGHQLVNRSADNARYLVVGNRHPNDVCAYTDDDLAVRQREDGTLLFSRKTGDPLE